MYDLNKQSFVVLTFATVSELRDNKNDLCVTLQRDAIVEVAAVKIENGVIQGHYHSFVGIDGYDAHDIEFDCGNYGAYGVRAEHLIGAPSLKEAVGELSAFASDSVLLVHSASSDRRNPFTVFKDCAKNYGYCFNNPTVELKNISAAARLQSAVQSSGADLADASIIQTANMLVDKRENWTDILADHGIYFDPENDNIGLRDRNDSLSWALIFAKLFVALVDCNGRNEAVDITKQPLHAVEYTTDIEPTPERVDEIVEE